MVWISSTVEQMGYINMLYPAKSFLYGMGQNMLKDAEYRCGISLWCQTTKWRIGVSIYRGKHTDRSKCESRRMYGLYNLSSWFGSRDSCTVSVGNPPNASIRTTSGHGIRSTGWRCVLLSCTCPQWTCTGFTISLPFCPKYDQMKTQKHAKTRKDT